MTMLYNTVPYFLAYYPHRHKNINFSKKIVVLPAPTDNPHQLLDQNYCCRHFVYIRPARDHAIFTRKMAADLILIAHFTNVILVYSTIIRLL